MAMEIAKATTKQIQEVLHLLVGGVTSDATSMEEIAGSWWRRFLFLRWFGPRLLGNQMDTFVATQDDRIIGFLIVQYDGDMAGTFDWAFMEPLNIEQNREDFAELIDTVLDDVEEQGHHPYFYFGFASDSLPQVGQVLEEVGLRAVDYQSWQMVGKLPLAEPGTRPPSLRMSMQIPARFGPQMDALLPAAYPDMDPAEIAMISSLHAGTLRSSKVFLIEEQGQAIGFVQQFRWRDELRLLIALPQRLWGSDEERLLVAQLAHRLQGRNTSLRIRTFSQGHLEASRDSLSPLGLQWEQAPWQRRVVALGEDELQ